MTFDRALYQYIQWRDRTHKRACIEARSCTCPETYDLSALLDARKQAAHNHKKFDHAGTVERCGEPHDVICKAVFP